MTAAILLTKMYQATSSRRFLLTGFLLATIVYNAQSQKPAETSTADSSRPDSSKPDSAGKQKVSSLQAVTVTGKKPFIVFTPDKITLNVAESPIAAGGNIYDAILRGPGVMSQGGSLTFRERSVQVLINGRPTRLSGDDLKNMLTGMPAGSVDKVEILPTPPSKYEAEGSAVINIVLAKNKSYGANYVLTGGVGAGIWPTENAGLDVNYRNKDINLFGGYTYLGNKQFYNTVSDRLLTGSEILANEHDVRTRNNNGYKLGLDYDLSKRTTMGVLVNGYVNWRKRDVSNRSQVLDEHGLPDTVSLLSTRGYAKFSSPTVNAYYKTTFDSTGKALSFNVDYLRYNKQWRDSFANHYLEPLNVDLGQPGLLRDHSPAVITVWSYSADYVQPVRSGKWEAGIRVNHTRSDNNIFWEANSGFGWATDSSMTNHFVYTEEVNAAYLSHSHTFGRWTVEAGLRAEQTIATGNSVTLDSTSRRKYLNVFPTVSLNYAKSDNLQWNLSYKQSIQRFGFDYINPSIIYQSQYYYFQGNPNLEPQINHTFALSAVIKGNVQTGVEYTHSVKPLGPSYHSQGDLTISSYANFKDADAEDIYLSYSKTFFSIWQTNLYGSVGYLSFNLNTLNGDSTPPQSQDQRPFAGIQWYNSINLKAGWSAEITAMYTSSIVTGIFHQKPYYSADAGIAKELWAGKVTARLSLTDVFNTLEQKLHTNYDGVNMEMDTKSESRFVNLVIKYRFGNNKVRASRSRQSKLDDINSRIR